jgi:predicted ATPase
VLRIKGEILLLQNRSNAAAAEDHFSRSLDWARRQGTLSWELRTAISLARLHKEQRLIERARDLLAPVYARFTEGFGTVDLLTAKRLLRELT